MPRKRWRVRERRGALTEALRFHLETGAYPKTVPDVDALVVWMTPQEEYWRLWQEHGAEILADWIAARPGSRPWGWWRFAATEPRRCLDGAELLAPVLEPGDWEWHWRGCLGMPAFVALDPDDEWLPTIEGTGAYLRRAGLLHPGEQPAPATLEPEPLHPWHAHAQWRAQRHGGGRAIAS